MIALVWNPVRKSIWGPTIVSVGILVGTWLNMMRIYVSAASVPDSEITQGQFLDLMTVQRDARRGPRGRGYFGRRGMGPAAGFGVRGFGPGFDGPGMRGFDRSQMLRRGSAWGFGRRIFR